MQIKNLRQRCTVLYVDSLYISVKPEQEKATHKVTHMLLVCISSLLKRINQWLSYELVKTRKAQEDMIDLILHTAYLHGLFFLPL